MAGVEAQLEKTRGQTVSLHATMAEAPGVWQKGTEAVLANKKAQEELAKQQAEADAKLMTSYQNRLKIMEESAKATIKNYSFEGAIAALQQLDAAEQELARNVYAQITSEKDRLKVLEEYNRRHMEIMNEVNAREQAHVKVVNDAILAEFAAQQQLNGVRNEGTTALDKYNASMDALHAKRVAGISQAAQEQVIENAYTNTLLEDAKAQDAAYLAQQKTNEELKNGDAAAQKTTASMQTYGGAVGNATKQLQDFSAAQRIAAMPPNTPEGGSILSNPSNPNQKWWVPNIGTAGGMIGGQAIWNPFNVGQRWTGGNVAGETPYLVGEKGPELFVPEGSGRIVSNSQMNQISFGAGAVQQHYPIINDPQALNHLADIVGTAILGRLQRQGMRA